MATLPQLVVTGIAVVAAAGGPALAQCPAGYPFADCAADIRHARLDERLKSDPVPSGVEARIDGGPWIASAWNTAPFAMMPIDKPQADAASLQASLAHWNAYTDSLLARQIDEARKIAPGLVAPKSYGRPLGGLDVWSRVEMFAGDSARATFGQFGADYNFGRKALVGVAVGLREQSASAVENDRSFSAYVAFRAASALTFGFKAEHSETSASLAGHGLAATQDVVSARATGLLAVGALRLSPGLTLAHGFEQDASGVAGATERTTLQLAPRISRPFMVPNGQKIEPFVRYSTEIEVFAQGIPYPAAQTVGAGVTMARPESYSLTLSADVERLGVSDHEVKSRLQLSVPLR